MKEVNWSTQTAQNILKQFHVQVKYGLSRADVVRQREASGSNLIAQEKATSPVQIFFSQFKSALIYILVIAAGISFALGHQTDAWVILAAVILNVVVGFIQEYRAEKALKELKKIVTFAATVIRDSREQSIDPTKLVVGDIVKLTAGSKVPADVRIIEAEKLQINEAPLTGESLAVQKDASALKTAVVISEKNNMAFFGTTIVGGTGLGVVVATGKNTEIGKIAKLLSETDRESTPLQEKLQKFSKSVLLVILFANLIIFGVGVFLRKDFVEIFTTAVALAVAAIPEGLVVVLTVILAIGMQRILKQHALVRKLVAAETLGSTTVICTDKTGTLTEGEMHVVRILTDEHDADILGAETQHPESTIKALQYGVLSSDAHLENPNDAFHKWRIFGGPTERALISAAAKFGVLREQIEKEYPRINEVPFSSEKKYMLTFHRDKKKTLQIFKGAPEILLEHATKIDKQNHITRLTDNEKKLLNKQYRKLSSEGLRILGIGFKECEKDFSVDNEEHHLENLVFLGFFCLQDPLRDDVQETIEQTLESGIRTVMLTGDHKLTAQAIAKEIGLPAETKNIIDGKSLEGLTQKELDKRITDLHVYARVSPKDKLRIISAWQRRGAVVAMTGDGVNDAPALKAADIGIALGSGTDVAKETADMVLLENNFSVIIRAIEEGRVIFSNIKKVILYLMSDSFTGIVLISFALFLGIPLPLIAAQILWINLVSDGLPALAMTMEPKEADVMKDKPIPRNEPIFTSRMKLSIILVSLLTGVGALILFYAYYKITGDIDRARTVTFLAVSLDSLLYVFSVRILRKPIWKQKFFSNPWLIVAIIVAFFIQLAAVYIPFFRVVLQTVVPTTFDWLMVAAYMLIGTVTFEILKAVFKSRNSARII